jgi:hypothetical protein
MSAYLTSKTCPHCGEVDSLVVDYQRGEVACSACCIVTEGALLEDAMTAWHDDIGVDEGTARRDLSSINHVGAASAADGSNKSRERVLRDTIYALQQRVGVPEVVADAALAYANEAKAKMMASNVTQPDQRLLAAACFNIAGVIRHYPIQAHEILSFGQLFAKGATEVKLDEIRQKVLALLPEIRESLEKANREYFLKDLVALVGGRLRPRQLTKAQQTVAALVAQLFSLHVASEKAALVAAFAVFTVLAQPDIMSVVATADGAAIRSQGAPTVTSSREQDLAVLCQVATASRLDVVSLSSTFSSWDNRHREKMAKLFAAVKAEMSKLSSEKTSTEVGVAKRERDVDDRELKQPSKSQP